MNKDWSKKSYMFNVKDAIDHGMDVAVMLHHFRFWLDKNVYNGKHKHDGYYWTYNSARAFSELMPFWSQKKMQRVLSVMKSKGLILCGNFNRAGFDRTLWYSMPEYEIDQETSLGQNDQMHCPDMSNGDPDSVQTIPQDCPMHYPDMSNALPASVQPIPDSKLQILNTDSKLQILKTDIKLQISKEVAVAPDLDFQFLSKIPKKYHADVIRVINHWAATMGISVDLTKGHGAHSKRAVLIKNMLSDGYVLQDCLSAVTGCLRDDHHMGRNGGKKYNAIHNIFTHHKDHFNTFIRLSKGEGMGGVGGYRVPSLEEFDALDDASYGTQYDFIDMAPENRLTD